MYKHHVLLVQMTDLSDVQQFLAQTICQINLKLSMDVPLGCLMNAY